VQPVPAQRDRPGVNQPVPITETMEVPMIEPVCNTEGGGGQPRWQVMS